MSAQILTLQPNAPRRYAALPPVTGGQMTLLVADVARLWAHTMGDVARRAGLDLQPAEIRALSVIVRNPGLRPSQLAEWLHVGPMTLKDTLEGLMERDLVEDRPSAGNRRHKSIHPTPDAIAIAEKLDEIMDQVGRYAFATVDDVVVRATGQALLEMRFRLADYMEGAKAEPPPAKRRPPTD
ncbi:MarR family winged helix-turn-helix transcriptional regulator [Antarcticirhabdus aurantiaca]|uniref:MarR family winged helix-turn-helix transcriptional regulator n=1 Tax=Antarcticirhabdus aurantiaca TaxID=2606717 RepID=A0ACD4NQZ2_9HYPH|nr:MarR family winged helix-turn-helix transcriptional regulator [Jeongeuplla avenae]